jgi:hypothetical protein
MARLTIDYETDWVTRLRNRIYTQWRDSVSWNKWAEFLGRQFQELEDATQSLLTTLDIDNSVGAQLDVIGRLIGQVRGGFDDATYRLFLKARIQANRSTGGGEDIYNVFRALYGETIGLVITTSPIKTLVLRVKGAITAAQAGYGVQFFTDSKEVGVRGLLEWQEYSDDSMLIFTDAESATDGTTKGLADVGETFGGRLAGVLQA